jgi:chemosensory pili system protein ChpC
VFHALSKALAAGYLGIIAQGFPQMIRINRTVIELDEDYEVTQDSPVFCQVRMINERALVPDLEKLEATLQQQLGERP